MGRIEIADAFDEDADWLIPAKVLVPTGDFEIPTLTNEVIDEGESKEQVRDDG